MYFVDAKLIFQSNFDSKKRSFSCESRNDGPMRYVKVIKYIILSLVSQ